ncbi:hypothetical protein [Paenibacillus radicis (ex Gao et al. 2016)]|nr:hypothetical protein [Paenibacillus radicis (ex Gao et al. 2016)]
MDGDKEETLFKGLVSSVQTTNRNGIYTIEIEGISGSFHLDTEKKSRSFQDSGMSYSALLDIVVRGHSSANVIATEGNGVKLGKAAIQYKETDWAFIKRLSSELQTIVSCDILDSSPRFYFGLPEGKSYKLADDTAYTAKKDLLAFKKAREQKADAQSTDFFYYEIESSVQYALGDEIQFRNKKLYVSSMQAYMDGSGLRYKYRLSRREGILQQPRENVALKGLSLEGMVLEVKGEQVKLHLDIDKEAGAKSEWFPFAPPTGNAMYSMPQIGTHASLYFPDGSAANAIVVGAVRKNGSSSPKTSNPNNRYFGTEHGSELEMTPTALNLTGGSKEPLRISFDDNYGITLTSHKKLTLNAADEISLFTPKRILINAQSQILARKGQLSNGLIIESEYHLVANNVIAVGSDRTSYIVYNDEPTVDAASQEAAAKEAEAATKKKFSWGKLAAVVGAAVAIVVVAAVIVGTGGAAAPFIAMAAVGMVGALATTYASDLQSGEDSSLGKYIWNTTLGGIIGAVTGGIFGPVVTSASLIPMATSQLVKMQVTSMLAGGAATASDYVLTETFNGRMPRLDTALKSFRSGVLFAGFLGPLAPYVSKAVARISTSLGNKWRPKPIEPQTSANNGLEKKGYEPKPGERSTTRETEGMGNPKLPSDKELSDSINEWSNMQKKLAPSKTKRNDFNTASLVYDARTGKYYYGMNKGVRLSGDAQNPVLFGSKDKAGLLPKDSLNDYPLGNCAEVDGVNQALNDGAKIGDLYLYTTKTTPAEFGAAKEACQNCTFTFKGNVLDALTGWYKGD